MSTSLLLQATAVATGAAIGALLRWGAALWWNPLYPALPLGTLAVNVGGGFAVGMAAAWLAVHPNEALRLFAVVGVLGGLTTFSTFSLESLALLQRGEFTHALLHSAAHLLGALACAALGWWPGAPCGSVDGCYLNDSCLRRLGGLSRHI